jgi:hypothetical protein
MPCGRLGAHAAWLRLAVLTYNVLSGLKRLALPPELLLAKPKRLRFLIFNTAGRILHHARSVVCRLRHLGVAIGGWCTVLAALPLAVPGLRKASLTDGLSRTIFRSHAEVSAQQPPLLIPKTLAVTHAAYRWLELLFLAR